MISLTTLKNFWRRAKAQQSALIHFGSCGTCAALCAVRIRMRGSPVRARKHHTMAEIYVPTEAYRAAVDAIAAKTGVDPDEIKIALGEFGNVWPDSICADVAA